MIQKAMTPTRMVLFSFLFLSSLLGIAQISTFGNMHIFNGANLAIHGVNQSFLLAADGSQNGIVGTDRTMPNGYVAYMGESTWNGVSDKSFVDGYVMSYNSGFFIFPIGDDAVYRPIAISRSSDLSPTTAAYYRANPNIAVTSSLKGGNEPVLPPDGPFSPLAKRNGITGVSTHEYWDINGETPAKITLTWIRDSNIAELIGSDLSNLKIVGWDGTEWVEIPSEVDGQALFGGQSTLDNGSISTNLELSPSTYSVYTLAGTQNKDVEVFNALTPNADGENDLLLIKGLEKYPDNELEVYNRWGVLVYRTENYGQSDNYFTGLSNKAVSFSRDASLPSGTYFYVLKYSSANGTGKVINGYLFLNR